MSCYVYPVFFLFMLFACCELCGQGCVAGQVQTSVNDNGNLFDEFLKPEKGSNNIKFDLDSTGNDKVTQIAVKSIKLINFVAVNSVMVALAQVIKNDDDHINILAKFYKIKEAVEWGTNAVKKEENNWKIQLAADKLETKASETVMKSSIVLAEEEETIYYFTFSNKIKKSQQLRSDASIDWKIRLFEGKIAAATGAEKINWTPSDISVLSEDSQLKKKLSTQEAEISVCDSFAFVSGNKKYIAFVIEDAKAAGDKNKYIIAIFQLEVSGQKTFKFFAESSVDCLPSVFQWNEKIIMMPTDNPKDCSKKVIEFDVSKKSFTESENSIARLRDFLKDKNNFVTATIGEGSNNNVLLFTQEKINGNKKNDAHLYITDGTRVGYAGIIVNGIATDNRFYGFILYTNSELFALHQTYDTDTGKKKDNEFSLTRLKDQLSNITKILGAWNKYNNDEIKKSFENVVTATPPDFTDGLVGYLSDDGQENNIWKDKYLNVNATITPTEGSPKKVENGLEFSGVGVGAQWSVGEEKDQPYSFINSGFTLMTVVTVGSVTSSEVNSILGVGTDDNPNYFSLWCSKGGKWGVKVGNGKKDITTSKTNCTINQKYYVALILEKTNVLSVYVNGEQLKDLEGAKMQIDKSKTIKHFYFGVNNQPKVHTTVETHVTIKTVLLYNRPFTTNDEILNLKPKQNVEAETHETAAGDTNKLAESEKRTTETDTQPTGEAPTENDDVQSSSPPPTTEDSAVRVGVVGVLCFMLFGVFTLLGRYVY